MKSLLTFLLLAFCLSLSAQQFYFGNDLSYVNEMEDCGVIYKENNIAKDPYALFAEKGGNLARFRLWHSPVFYDSLNAGNRYSDYNDVRKSMMRAKTAGMNVLLDFHFSDFWADPGRQIVPLAWLNVVDNLPVLKDSLYNYVYGTLMSLDNEGLMPEMVQIGNETNKGIMQSPQADAAGWALDWPRNSQLFKRAIEAVRAAEVASGKNIKIALHIANPADAGWLMQGFWSNGVRDFDIIGLSYYWSFHKPTTIDQTGNIITQLRTAYAGKNVMIFETGYIWTTGGGDGANNVINETHTNYAPASPQNQLDWMVDLTKKVIEKGGIGVIYWEPAWVSSTCRTPWGQGSHYENAAFFNFQKNLHTNGGMDWMLMDYGLSPAAEPIKSSVKTLRVWKGTSAAFLKIFPEGGELPASRDYWISLYSLDGRKITDDFEVPASQTANWPLELELPDWILQDLFCVTLSVEGRILFSGKVAR